LVNFIQHGVEGGDEPGENSPRPVPRTAIPARGTNTVIEENAENEVFREMGGFADEMVCEFETGRRDGRE
jgi:hypothetical protein